MLQVGFILLAVGLVAGIGFVLRCFKVGLWAGVWLIITGIVGATEVLADFSSMPPRPMFLLLPMLVLLLVVVKSDTGRALAGLPLKFLVGFQSFRILVELLIHQAVVEGIAPPQMTWSGLNLDILTGITALILMPFADRLPKWVLASWNWMGLVLLIWVVGVGILSMPTAFQLLEPDNTWIAYFPFIWLPAIFVLFAAAGHIILFRKLRSIEG